MNRPKENEMNDWSKLDADRKAAGRRIDPQTAMVWFEYAEVLDPYGDDPNLPECYYVGRQWFAADPVEQIRVHFYDLPDATQAQLQGQRDAADREGWERLIKPTG